MPCHTRLCDTSRGSRPELRTALAASGDLTEIAGLIALIARRP